jgi:hemolysin III
MFIIAFCAPLLVAGGLGSTLFHAFRMSRFFLFLDVLPIVILTLGVSVYFLYRVSGNWYVPAIVILASFGLRWLTSAWFSGQDAINLYYAITGALIFIPALLFLIRTGGRSWKWIMGAIVLFSLALIFRFIDDFPDPGLAMGTHWLWHICCALGAYALGRYIIDVSVAMKQVSAA